MVYPTAHHSFSASQLPAGVLRHVVISPLPISKLDEVRATCRTAHTFYLSIHLSECIRSFERLQALRSVPVMAPVSIVEIEMPQKLSVLFTDHSQPLDRLRKHVVRVAVGGTEEGLLIEYGNSFCADRLTHSRESGMEWRMLLVGLPEEFFNSQRRKAAVIGAFARKIKQKWVFLDDDKLIDGKLKFNR